MRRLACLLAFAGCADILGIRDPVLPESGDASPVDAPGVLDGPPSAIDAPPVPDARMGPDANTCTWPYEPIDFNPCSLPADNGDLTLNGGTIEIDTDTIHTGAGDISLTNRQTQAQPGASCPLKLYVFLTGTLSGTINVRGTCPAALIFLGDVTIAGGTTLDASAEATAGPGGNDATACATATGTKGGDVTAALSAAGGGGGGGHGATGGMGAAGGGTAGGGGGAFGETAAEPPGLHGGCAGGEGGNGNLSGGGSGGGGAPGDGGGALQMSSKGTIRVNGTARLRANGGGGQGAQLLGGLLEATGGGGGGSGGTILLEAALVDFLPTANKPTLCATGGGGGEGGGSTLGAGGADGQPGTCSATANANGGGDKGNGGNGGDGGYGDGPLQVGRPGGSGTGGGGGGGGAAGRIIVHSQQTSPVGDAVFSPSVTLR